MDTLLRDPFREALTAATGLSLRELFERRDPTVYPAFERGELDEAAYWAHYAAAGIEADPAAFHEHRRAGLRWLPGMRELLDELDGVVIRIAATNYPVWVDELTEDHLGERFERIVASCHVGVRKPDAGFYRCVLDEVALPAHQVAFVDDREVNVDGARRLGMPAHRFEDVTALRRWLVDLGLELPPG